MPFFSRLTTTGLATLGVLILPLKVPLPLSLPTLRVAGLLVKAFQLLIVPEPVKLSMDWLAPPIKFRVPLTCRSVLVEKIWAALACRVVPEFTVTEPVKSLLMFEPEREMRVPVMVILPGPIRAPLTPKRSPLPSCSTTFLSSVMLLMISVNVPEPAPLTPEIVAVPVPCCVTWMFLLSLI